MTNQKIFVFSLLIAVSAFTSCNWAKDKTKDVLHEGGEIVGKAGSEVVDGVTKGVEEAYANLVEPSQALMAKGIRLGQIKVLGTDSSTDNIVSVYLIFEKNYSGKISAKAIDDKGLEFGRTSMDIVADSGQAKFIDFAFDKRTNIDKSDKVTLE